MVALVLFKSVIRVCAVGTVRTFVLLLVHGLNVLLEVDLHARYVRTVRTGDRSLDILMQASTMLFHRILRDEHHTTVLATVSRPIGLMG